MTWDKKYQIFRVYNGLLSYFFWSTKLSCFLQDTEIKLLLMQMKCKEGLCYVSVYICYIYWKKFCFKFLFSFGFFFCWGGVSWLFVVNAHKQFLLFETLYFTFSIHYENKNIPRTNELRISLITRGMTLKWLTIRYTLIIHSKDQEIKLWNKMDYISIHRRRKPGEGEAPPPPLFLANLYMP